MRSRRSRVIHTGRLLPAVKYGPRCIPGPCFARDGHRRKDVDIYVGLPQAGGD